MTTELTKAAQQAIEALIEASGHVHNEAFTKVMMARDALVSALTQRPAAQTDEQTIVEICERIGFGRVQQIAGHAWEQKHHCAPRGRMGVTVRNETPTPQQATPAQPHISAEALARMSKRLDDVDSAQPGFQYAKGWNAALRQAMDYAQQATHEPLTSFEDPRAQIVYDLLCSDEAPPPEQHWEGWVARRIVDALAAAQAKGGQP